MEYLEWRIQDETSSSSLYRQEELFAQAGGMPNIPEQGYLLEPEYGSYEVGEAPPVAPLALRKRGREDEDTQVTTSSVEARESKRLRVRSISRFPDLTMPLNISLPACAPTAPSGSPPPIVLPVISS
jgi:hypothetical protein